MSSYTYILECADQSLYTGWTTDLKRRLNTHNKGRGAKYTRSRLPVRLVYYEVFACPEQARKREYEIKKMSRLQKLQLIDRTNEQESQRPAETKRRGKMLHFDSDYMEAASPEILERLTQISGMQYGGYGTDDISESAREKIRRACQAPAADVFFLTGGTQTNATVIRSMLRLYEGVVCAQTGHIATHEAGAIEAGGHKVMTIPQKEGKISAEAVRAFLETYHTDENREHMPAPGMVYISHPTEYGTLYSAGELKDISSVCRGYGIPLYLDGARLAYALAAEETDVSLELIAACCDAFYIGGTKCGALFGEAVVFPGGAPKGFFSIIKQSGALLAKGWIAGLQFDVLFTDRLYRRNGEHAVRLALMLREGLLSKGYKLQIDSPTNQQFVVLEDKKLNDLRKQVSCSFWEKPDAEHTVVRFATSWASREEDVRALLDLL